MNVTRPPAVPVQVQPVQTLYSHVTCPLDNSGLLGMPRFYGIPQLYARRFEVEDLARMFTSPSGKKRGVRDR
jgi:hypothetical protein